MKLVLRHLATHLAGAGGEDAGDIETLRSIFPGNVVKLGQNEYQSTMTLTPGKNNIKRSVVLPFLGDGGEGGKL